MADKAVHYNWLPWLPKSFPSEAIIPWVPYVLCNMHKELLKGKIEPDDDIYAQLPCTLVHGKRFNMKKEQAYLMFGRRYQKKVYAGRQIAGCRAKWDSKDGWDKVCAQNGDVVGVHYGMFLRHEGVKSEESAVWTADEYISISSEAGDSSVVVLRCKNREWNQVEEHIELAETQLFENYKQLIKAEHEGFTSEVEMLKPDVFNSQALLGFAISEFEAQRAVLREAQDKSAGAKPGVYDDTDFGLRVPCAASVTVGAFYTFLNQRKTQENLKKIQKQNKTSVESSAAAAAVISSSRSVASGDLEEVNASVCEREGPISQHEGPVFQLEVPISSAAASLSRDLRKSKKTANILK